MASLKEATRNIYDDARDGIAWLVIWKVGRGWESDAIYIEYMERTYAFDPATINECRPQLEEIASIDPNAIIVNPFYDNLGPFEEMTLETLADGIRWQYEEVGRRIVDVLEMED